MKRLEGKVAIVTGSNGGIGSAVAKGFLQEGACVVFTEHRSTGAAQHAMSTGASEDKWMVHKLDAGDPASVRALVEDTVARFGRLDIMVAHAGSHLRKNLLDITDEEFTALLRNNCSSVFFCCQEAARIMIPNGGGSIICTTSMASFIGRPKSVAYGATKGCVSAMVKHLAYELAPYNIRVNGMAPGTILTNQNRARLSTPEALAAAGSQSLLNRVGNADEMIGAAIYLASDESTYVTGTELVVDGGLIIK